MNKYLASLLFIFSVIAESKSDTIFNGVQPIPEFVDHNVVAAGGYVMSNTGNPILINQNSVFITNYGTIDADIDVNGNNLGITNSGTITGKIVNTSSQTATVLQTISDKTEFKSLQLGSNIDLWVDINNINNLSLESLKSLNAGHYEIANSDIYIEDLSEWNAWKATVDFFGENNFRITDSSTVDPTEPIKDVDNSQNVNVEITDTDNTTKTIETNTNAGVTIDIVRETNIDKVLPEQDHRKDLLNKLRNNEKDDAFMSLVDTYGIDAVQNKSYHFNHKILTRPLYVNNNLLMLDFISEHQDTNVDFDVVYIGGDKIDGFAGKANVGGHIYDNLYFGIGLNVNNLNYNNKINDFDVMTYGPSLRFGFDKKDFWIKGKTGLSFDKYKASDIYFDSGCKDNPHGKSAYGILDFGYNFDLQQNLTVGVFSGGSFQRIKVLDAKDNDKSLHIGSKVKYSYEIIGIKYEANGFGGLSNNGDLFGGVEFGLFSVLDEVGAYVKLEAYKNRYDLNYQATVNMKTMF